MSTATIATLVLAAVALAVLFAATFAVFGKPHSSGSKKRHAQVVSGFAIAGGILLGALLIGVLVIGIGFAFFGIESSRILSKTMALMLAAASFAVIALFVQRWAKYFAGWMAWSVFNALAMASRGHMLNNPSVPVPRTVALAMAALMLVTVLASVRFGKGYRLNAVDKTALLLWVLAFAIGANTKHYMLQAIAIGCVGLLVASAYHRYCEAHSHAKSSSNRGRFGLVTINRHTAPYPKTRLGEIKIQ